MDHALPAARIQPLGWALIAFRLSLMVLVLVACAPLHLLWRLVGGGRWWPRVFLSAIGMICGLQVRVRGKPAKGALLLANHVSWLDIPALAQATGTAFVAHDGLAAFPFLKWLCEMNDTVFIARHDRRSVHAQVEQVRAAIAERGALAIFPEGTTSDGTGLLPFKSSLLSAFDPPPAGVAIQPVLFDYGPEAASVAWVGEEHGLDNFLRILASAKPVELTIRFLSPLEGEALANRKTIAAAAQAAIQGAMR